MERDSRTCHAQHHLPVADARQTGLREENAPASNLELTRNRGIVGRGKCWPWDDYPVVGDGERLVPGGERRAGSRTPRRESRGHSRLGRAGDGLTNPPSLRNQSTVERRPARSGMASAEGNSSERRELSACESRTSPVRESQ